MKTLLLPIVILSAVLVHGVVANHVQHGEWIIKMRPFLQKYQPVASDQHLCDRYLGSTMKPVLGYCPTLLTFSIAF